jgi:phenylacetic acid degradation operon negative regulatory protein
MPAQTSVTEEVLLMLLWTAEQLSQPTFRNLTESYEGWKWRNRIPRQLQRMEERKLLAREKQGAEMVFRLTSLGRLRALGGRNPQEQWARPWDGLWRQVLFDLPIGRPAVRTRLWRWLRDNGFGYLQQSLWVHPHPVKELLGALEDFRDDVETFLLMEARCCAGYSDEAVVQGAWDFEEINRRHEAYQSAARLDAGSARQLLASADKFSGWLRSERIAWHYALSADPLLPRVLWPKGYRGEASWEARKRAFNLLAARLCP